MAFSFTRKPRLSEYTSVDIDYDTVRVAVTTRTKNGFTVRAARKDLSPSTAAPLPENPTGKTLTPEAATLITDAVQDLFSTLKAPTTRVGINSPDRGTTLAMLNVPPLKPKDLTAAVNEHAASLMPSTAPTRTSYHVLTQNKSGATVLLCIISSNYAANIANAVRAAGAHVDLMQPRIISIINTVTSLHEPPEHPLLLAHISMNATSLAVLKHNRSSSADAKLLQFARVMPLGAEQAIQQATRYSRELHDTIVEHRSNVNSPAGILITGRHHNHPRITETAQAAHLHLHSLALPHVTNTTPDVTSNELPPLLGLALTRLNA